MNKKNCVFWLVVVMMVFGLVTMVGCPTDEDGGNDKVVAEKYRGKWVDDDQSSRYFILTEKTRTSSTVGNPQPAHTEGNVLYSGDMRLGEFDDDGETFTDNDGDTYTKQDEE